MQTHVETLKRIKAGILAAPDGFKQPMSYAALSKHTGVSEKQLIRWMTGKHTISPAYDIILSSILRSK